MENSSSSQIPKEETTTESNPGQIDQFSRRFFFIGPFLIPVIVTSTTYAFYTCCKEVIWLPLLLIYWATIWTYTLVYRKKRGGVFSRERFKPTLKLQGKYLWLQYLVTYGPFIYAIPLFIINYAAELTVNMYIVILLASIVNGPSEEVFWRACMDDAGKNAGVTEKNRLIFAPIAFALWHTAFVIHLYPWDSSWFLAWAGIIAMTWSSGLVWLWVLHRSGRLIPQCLYHACANFLNIFPMILVTVLHASF